MSIQAMDRLDKPKPRRPLWYLLIPFLFLAALLALVFWRCELERPQLAFSGSITPIGQKKAVSLVATDTKSGLRRLEIALAQEGKQAELLSRDFPRQGFFSRSGPNRVEETLDFELAGLDMHDGEATLVATIRDYSWWRFLAGNEITLEFPVVIDTRPPVVRIIGATRYLAPGGAGVVVYKVSEPVGKTGVVLNDFFHPGFPAKTGEAGVFVAYIGLAYNAAGLTTRYALAEDEAGNEGRSELNPYFRDKAFRKDRIGVSDSFLALKMPEFTGHYPELAGTDLEKYLYVNGTIRKENNRRLLEACGSPLPEQLWEGPFSSLPRAAARAGFADHRSYLYNGEEVDRQVHLGIDLASTQNAPVPAANNGVVTFADYLGIYGNTVILDHGQGIFSLYSHLSQILVNKGDRVPRDAEVGLTGATGMAGGDHLHFSMLVNGLFVSPLEWWDPHWLQVSVLDFLPKSATSR